MATWENFEKVGTKFQDLKGMTRGELGEFCTVNPKAKQIPDDMEVSFVPMQRVSDTGDVQTDEIRKASEVKKGFTFFEEDDVLFAKITPCMENGKGGIARGLKNGVGFGSTEFHVLHPDPERVSSEWLYYLTSWDEFRKQCARNMTGSAGQKRVPKSYLEHYKVHLPPLEEQRRIAALLDKVSDLIAKRRAQLDKLDLLVKARFVEMFGDPILNQKGFPQYTVGDIITFQGGSQPDKKYFEYVQTDENIRLIQIRDYKSDKFITYIPKAMAKRFCSVDDIMIGRYGPPIFQILQGIEGAYNVALMKAIPKRGNKEFIRQFLKQDCLLEYLEGLSKRTAGQDGIQMDKLKEYPFPFPPIELQEKFEFFVKKVDKTKLTIQQSLDKLETLKKALMQKYFN